MAINGLVVMTPTSVAKTGASSTATINADGSVTFGSCETLSLNGVFTSDYDNYMITMRNKNASSTGGIALRLRLSGTDASGTDYTSQILQAEATSVTGTRLTSQTRMRINNSSTNNEGDTVYMFGPYLAQPTAARNVSMYGKDGGSIIDYASTHSLSTSYDGFTIFPLGGSESGLLTVFGFNQ